MFVTGEEGVQWPNERKPIFFMQDKSTVQPFDSLIVVHPQTLVGPSSWALLVDFVALTLLDRLVFRTGLQRENSRIAETRQLSGANWFGRR